MLCTLSRPNLPQIHVHVSICTIIFIDLLVNCVGGKFSLAS